MRHLLALSLAAALLASPAANASGATMGMGAFMAALKPASQTSAVQVRLAWDPAADGSGQQYSYSNPSAGEFIVEVNSGSSWDRIVYDSNGDGSQDSIYKTFCVEMAEYIDPFEYNKTGDGFWTVWATLDQNAIFGKNKDWSSSGDPLNAKTEALYGLYQKGLLSSLDLGAPGAGDDFQYQNKAWATALQEVIWAEEDLQTLALGSDAARLSNYFTPSVLAGYPYEDVQVINLWNDATLREPGNALQSQLIYNPHPLPEPAGLALWSGLALLGLTFSRRRLQRSACKPA